MNVLRADAPMTPDQQQARQLAQQELAQGKYHLTPSPTPPPPNSPSPPPSPTPSPTPTQAAAHHASSDLTTLLVIALIVVFGIVLLLVLRKIGKPRRGKDEKKKKKTVEEKGPDEAKKSSKRAAAPIRIPLTGAALHRYNAEQAAGSGDWQEAIRERFRAVIGVLDERGLLPERRDRTADEAARDAGLLLPEHAEALSRSALAFDEVEYGEYAGTPEGYAVICAVDEAVSSDAGRTVRR